MDSEIKADSAAIPAEHRDAQPPSPTGAGRRVRSSPGAAPRAGGTFVAVLVGAAFGSVIGAVISPTPGDRYQADAIIANIESSTPTGASLGDVQQGWRTVTEAVQLPQVAAKVAVARYPV